MNGIEFDFLTVGEKGTSGDAILVRYKIGERFTIGLIDGGFSETAEEIRKHVIEVYNSYRIDWIVNTHPDQDHTSGLLSLFMFEDIEIGELWMHQPWNYADNLENAETGKKLFKIATQQRIPTFEPFQGETIGEIFKVLSPSRDFYLTKVGLFGEQVARTPTIKTAIQTLKSILSETFSVEGLREGGVTSPKNETSTVLLCELFLDAPDVIFSALLTGDAGNEALGEAANFSITNGINLRNLDLIQIPHHGSRHNVSPSILDRIIGSRGTTRHKSLTAIMSVAPEANRPPHKMTVNAFIRRGCDVIETRGIKVRHYRNMAERPGWGPVQPVEFSSEVESYDD